MINDEQKKLITKAENAIDSLLTGYSNSPDPNKAKKARLLAFWLNDYARLLKKEDNFSPASFTKIKRGAILQAHLGFNIGSEEGGLHYVVVVSNTVPATSDVMTVVPLSSKKATYKPSRYNIDLGNSLFEQLNQKYETIQQLSLERTKVYKKQLQDLFDKRDSIIQEILASSLNDTIPKDAAAKLSSIMIEISKTNKNLEDINGDILTIDKIKTEISRMKSGSIALVGQITTISKLRIYNPIKKTDSLHGIRLSPDELDLLDEKIKELFTNTKN